MPNKILVAADATPIVWAADVGYGGSGGVQTEDISLAGLVAGAAQQGDVADLDRGVVANRYPHEFAITMRMTFPTNSTPTAGRSIDLYWVPTLTIAGPFPDGILPDGGIYTGTTGSTLAESLKNLQFLGPLVITGDDEIQDIQQITFRVVLPTQFGVPVIVNSADESLADAEFLSITFTPRELEAQ